MFGISKEEQDCVVKYKNNDPSQGVVIRVILLSANRNYRIPFHRNKEGKVVRDNQGSETWRCDGMEPAAIIPGSIYKELITRAEEEFAKKARQPRLL